MANMGENKRGIELYKTVSQASKKGKSPQQGTFKEPLGVSDQEKAARLLILLGLDEAAKIMEQLNPQDVAKLTRQIVGLQEVGAEEATALLEEFGEKVGKRKPAHGGFDFARQVLRKAYDNKKAGEILAKAIHEPEPEPFSFLNKLTSNQLANLLQKETPASLSLILPYLDPLLASKILQALSKEQKAETVRRIARNQKISREVLMKVEDTLREKIRDIATDDSVKIDGQSALIAILRHMDKDNERRLLKELDKSDHKLSEKVKINLLTMDTVLQLRKKDLQNILHAMPERNIAMILRGQKTEIQKAITESLSPRKRILVNEESDLLGLVPKKDVDACVREFLEKIRRGEDTGTYILFREDDEYIE